MSEPLVLVLGFFLAVITSEVLLRGTKIQTGLAKVLLAHGVWLSIVWVYMMRTGKFSIVTISIFWAGAFLTWFGVRSHIESSILLRMLYLLRKQPRAGNDLLQEYASHYSEESRLEELFRGGLLQMKSGQVTMTPKGRFIASVASHLK